MGGQVEQGILNYEVETILKFYVLKSKFNILFLAFCL